MPSLKEAQGACQETEFQTVDEIEQRVEICGLEETKRFLGLDSRGQRE